MGRKRRCPLIGMGVGTTSHTTHFDAGFSKQIFDVRLPEIETTIKPDGSLNDDRRKWRHLQMSGDSRIQESSRGPA